MIYINDIVSKQFKFILFADDTNIIYSCKTTENVGTVVNRELYSMALYKQVIDILID